MMVKGSKKTGLGLEDAERQLAADTRTHPFDPTAQWWSSKDERTKRLGALAKTALAQMERDPAWRDVAIGALIEIGHSDSGRSAAKAATLLGEQPSLDLAGRRLAAKALAVAALASNAKGCWERAAAAYRDVLAVAKEDAGAQYMLAACLRRNAKALAGGPKMQKLDIPQLEEVVDLLADRREPLALRERGLALELLGRHSEASEALAAAIPGLRAEPALLDLAMETATHLAESLYASGKWKELVALHGDPATLEDDALDPVIVYQLVDALAATGAPDDAVALVERFRKSARWGMSGYDALVLLAGARAHRVKKDFAKAGALLDECLERNEYDAAAQAERASNRVDLGDVGGALAAIDGALAKLGRGPELVHALAAVKRASGAHEEAKALLREARGLGARRAAADAKAWYGETI
jgi:tetratricopeptide (TPR) repeat protein